MLASSASRPPGSVDHAGAGLGALRHHATSSSSASASATRATTAPPGRPGEQLGHVEDRQAGRNGRRGGARGAGADDASGLGELGGEHDVANARPGGVDEQLLGVAEAGRRRGLLAVEQRGQHAVGDDRRGRDPGLGGEPVEQLDRLDDGHLLGRRDDDDAGARRVLEDVEHPAGLVADHADLDQVADHPRGADLGDDVTARLGVDDDEVVVALANLVGELADAEDLLDAGRRVGDEVERAGQRADAPDERHARRTA